VWTTERRANHGLQDTANVCFTCLQGIDSIDHILLQCSYAKEVLFHSLRQADLFDVTPTVEDRLEDWWLTARARFRDRERQDFDTRVMLTCWSLWRQRNARAFNNQNQQCSAMQLVSRIKEELSLWKLARHFGDAGGSQLGLGESFSVFFLVFNDADFFVSFLHLVTITLFFYKALVHRVPSKKKRILNSHTSS
jgi:hypothetical protein